MAAACAAPVYFSTELNRTGGLGPGDRVTHGSVSIGHVTSVTPIGYGDSRIAFEVDGSRSADVHSDAIMLLDGQTAPPSLEVMNVDAMSSSAPSGSRLDGASNMNQAQIILSSRQPGSLAQAIARATTGSLNSPSQVPQAALLAQAMSQITQSAVAAANVVSPPTSRAALAQMQSDCEGVERQMNRNGMSEQALRVHDSMDRMLGGFTAPSNLP